MAINKLNIALIVVKESDHKVYMDFLSQYTLLQIDHYHTIQHFRQTSLNKKYSGIVIDDTTMINSSTFDKTFFISLNDIFPILQVSLADFKNDFNFILFNNKEIQLKGIPLFEHFINDVCIQQLPNQIRQYERHKLFFNILLYYKEKCIPMKANLWDISEGGCFIISNIEHKTGDPLWIRINEFDDKKKMKCIIEWVRPWGTNVSQLSGFGTSFTEISQNQVHEIKKINRSNDFNLNPAPNP